MKWISTYLLPFLVAVSFIPAFVGCFLTWPNTVDKQVLRYIVPIGIAIGWFITMVIYNIGK